MDPVAVFNQGLEAFKEGRLRHAVDRFTSAGRLNATFPEARVWHGRVLAALRDYDGAEVAWQEAEELIGRAPRDLPPDTKTHLQRVSAELEFCRVLVDLLHKRFDSGWRRYRAFYRTYAFPLVRLGGTLWNGEAMEEPLLIYADQGLGDGVQFSRFITQVAERCSHLHLLCDQPLARLLTTHFDFDRVWQLSDAQHAIHACRAYAPLTSLPGVFAAFVTQSVKGKPYIRAREDLVHYRDMMADKSVLHIGVVWRGNPKNTMDKIRSFTPNLMRRAAESVNARFYSLQRDAWDGEAKCIAPSERFVDLQLDMNQTGWDVLDTAAIVQNLDLVISCDTMPAHLAGAVGTRVWVAIADTPDWRWGLEGESTAWYDSMVLFRQARLGQWDSVFDRIATELPKLAAELGKTSRPDCH